MKVTNDNKGFKDDDDVAVDQEIQQDSFNEPANYLVQAVEETNHEAIGRELVHGQL